MTTVYMKCSFDCFVAIDEEWLREKFGGSGVLMVSDLVGTILTNKINDFNDLNSTTLKIRFAERGEITTKYISARQGESRFSLEKVPVSKLLNQFWNTNLTADEYEKLGSVELILNACKIRPRYMKPDQELFIKRVDYGHGGKVGVEFGIRKKEVKQT